MGIIRDLIGNQFADEPKSFSDVAKNYATNRINEVTQPFTDTEQYMKDRFTGNTDQSSRKPVTQTVTYNPDGTQQMTIKGSPYDLSAANPNTPTISAPAMVPVMTPERGQQLYNNYVQSQYAPTQPVRAVNPDQVPQIWSDITPGAEVRNQVRTPTQQVSQQPLQPQPGPIVPQLIEQRPPGWQIPGTSSQTYNRMIQQESGGQNYDAQGRPLTSPAGAMYAGQVMPSTAAAPGFGITPARDQSPEEYNRVGREVYGAMLNHWGNNEHLAVASYNAGPGRVQKAIEQAKINGGNWVDYLPKETQNYLAKVLPDRPGAPIAFNTPEETEHIVHDVPRGTPANFFLRNQKDPAAMVAMSYDPNLPPGYRQAAADQHTSLVTKTKEELDAEKKAQQIIANGGVGLQRELKKESEEGSYIKAYLFRRLGLMDLAKEEQQKLGAGDVWQQTMVGGKPAWVKYNGQGAPIKGYNAEGELDPKQLLATTGNLKNAQVGTQLYFDPTSKTSDKYYLRRVNGQAQFVSATTGEVETRPEVTGKLVGMSVAGSLPQQMERAGGVKLAQLQAQLAMIPPMERAKFISKFNAENGTSFPIDLSPAGVSVPGSSYVTPGGQAPAAPVQPSAPTGGAINPQDFSAPRPQGTVPMGTPSGRTPEEVEEQRERNMTPPAPVAPAPTPAGATPSTPTTVTPRGQGPVAPAPATPAEFTRQKESEKEQQTAFNKYHESEILPKATAGAEVANVRRQQINGPDGILNNPTIVGMMAGQGSAYDEVRNIIRDIATSKYDNIDLSQRVANLALSQREKDVLNTQISLRQQIAPLTLKANAGPGAISEAEHKINDRTIGDITRMPFYSTMTLISRDQFLKDQAQARAAFKEQHPELKTSTQFNAAWSKEQERLNKMYDNIYEARAKYIKQYNPDGKNPGATVDAFKHYPVPEFSPTEGWVLKGYSKKASMPSLDTFVR